ncbi:unnamed protein product [Didymodactylos carnosus]|uniref:NAD(P)(+)--arginine ADP-ribosyltransferase n=1 Tax=Didymodactylos carnosus TaxID=1234261 RepID=A0A816ATX9_9BILA|nr:unnamed protein product [Didymodactylos carnosus]CAF4477845.1 unnamed protein product [Didymodactylos carnosus]
MTKTTTTSKEERQILRHPQQACRRDQVDRHGLTAYEVAQTEEIRCLFHRPNDAKGFCADENISDTFDVIRRGESEGQDKDFVKDKWLEGHTTSDDIEKAKKKVNVGKMFFQSSLIMAAWTMGRKYATDARIIEKINSILLEHVTPAHSEYEKCLSLMNKTYKEGRPEYLLRLYSLETPFYRTLPDVHKHVEYAFQGLLYVLLRKIKSCYFQGVSYRGVKMTNEDLRGYRWTFRSAGVIETRTFCSTSSDRGVAEQFADTSTTDVDDKESVLMMFHFGEKCDTAINLNKLSPDLPCISEYEDEAEVLLLPLTFFNVKQIEQTSSYLAISLENVPSKRRSLLEIHF